MLLRQHRLRQLHLRHNNNNKSSLSFVIAFERLCSAQRVGLCLHRPRRRQAEVILQLQEARQLIILARPRLWPLPLTLPLNQVRDGLRHPDAGGEADVHKDRRGDLVAETAGEP